MVAVVSSGSLGLFNASLNQASGASALGQAGAQVYVNSASGNLIIQRQDQQLKGLGVDASFVRTYNSLGSIEGDADRWQFGFERVDME